MELKLYTFSKRRNSTARPTSSGISIDVKLKRSTSILNPVFLLQGDVEEFLFYDYAYYNGRYYFIDDVTVENADIVSISCSVDVLATYKTEIGSYTCFVERSASNYDILVYDKYLSSRTTSVVKTSTISGSLPWWSNDGTFLVRCIGQQSNASSVGISTFAVSKNQLLQMLDFLFTDSNFDFLSDTSVKSFFNPFQYVVSVEWFPFTDLAFRTGTLSDRIRLGWWDTGVVGAVVNKTSITFSETIELPTSAYNDYRRYSSDWTSLKLFVPSCGAGYLSPSECNNTLRVAFSIDIATGDALVKVFNENTNYLICTMSGHFSSSIAIGQLQTHELSAMKNASSALSDIMKLDIFSLFDKAVDSTIQMAQPTPCINGSAGNMGAILASPFISLTMLQYEGKDTPTTVLGRPCCSNIQLGTLTGYVKCAGASIPLESYSSERDSVNKYLNGGFYYE